MHKWVLGSSSCWLSSLHLNMKWKSSYWGIAVTGGLHFQKLQINMFPPKSIKQLCSSNLLFLELELFLSAIPLQKEAGWDTSPLCTAQGSWHEGNGKRSYFLCNPPGTVPCIRSVCLHTQPHISLTLLVPSHFKAQNCLPTGHKLGPKC